MLKNISKFGVRYALMVPAGQHRSSDFTETTARQVLRFHRSIPGYQPTRLVHLHTLARRWNVGEILIKDESTRFGLKAFKVLGGSYAVARLLCNRLGIDLGPVDFNALISDDIRYRIGQMTMVTATDGNHGRGVAWAAEQLRLKAVIYMPIGLLDLLANLTDFIPLKAGLDIGPHSRILFFNTEGATDPDTCREILWHGKYAITAYIPPCLASNQHAHFPAADRSFQRWRS